MEVTSKRAMIVQSNNHQLKVLGSYQLALKQAMH